MLVWIGCESNKIEAFPYIEAIPGILIPLLTLISLLVLRSLSAYSAPLSFRLL